MSRRLVVPEITLDRGRGESLRQQIFSQVAEAIRRGELAEGARLPSSRVLAKVLQVSRNTVVDALERLLEEGLVRARPGSGIEVNQSGRGMVPNLVHFRLIARAAHYPVRRVRVEDPDGTALCLNVGR